MKKYKVIGIMSGTSLDGLDIAYCEFEKKEKHWKYSIKEAITIPYKELKKKTLSCLMNVSAEELTLQNAELGGYIGKAIKKFVQAKKIKPHFISSHGHTIFHQPQRGFTLQIGSGAHIYSETQLPVVCDFRTIDVAMKGQGAPLVPIGDKLLFSQYEFCLNLGGISNVSFDLKGKRIAYDVSPVNIVLNSLALQLGKPYDKDGKIAAKGTCDNQLLKELNRLDFYRKKFPKSLGKEWIDSAVFPVINASPISIEEKITTFTIHTAQKIAEEILKYSSGKKTSLLVTGGGAFNKFLISEIETRLKGKVRVVVPDATTINFKEALVFAFLGVLKARNEVNCLSSVTGATADSIGGAWYGPLLKD